MAFGHVIQCFNVTAENSTATAVPDSVENPVSGIAEFLCDKRTNEAYIPLYLLFPTTSTLTY